MVDKGIQHERLSEAAEDADTANRLEQIERTIAAIESDGSRGGPTVDDGADERDDGKPSRDAARDHDWSPGR
jgi:hypothetical protein